METVIVTPPFADYRGPLELPRPAEGYVLVGEYSLRTASMLLACRSPEECEEVSALLLGSVGYSPSPKRGEPEPPPRFWPVQIDVLERAIRLLDEHGGAVSEAFARQFRKCLAT